MAENIECELLHSGRGEPQRGSQFDDCLRATSQQWVHALRPFTFDVVETPLHIRIWQKICPFVPAVLFCLWCVVLVLQLYWQPINCIVMCSIHLCWNIFDDTKQVIYSIIALRKIVSANANAYKRDESEPLCEATVGSLHHAVFVCAYKEKVDVLRDTLLSIAIQKGHATSYARAHIGVCLCMEAREGEEGQSKANNLVHMLQDKFAWMEIQYHPDKLPGEIQGKCSNLQWAIKNSGSRIGPGCLVTCCDADSMFDPFYFSSVSAKVVELGAAAFSTIFQPTIMHFLNAFEQTHTVRASSIVTSVYFAASLEDALLKSLPYSTFTISSDLLERINGWDPDYLNDDWHTGTKAFVALPDSAQIVHMPFPVVNCGVDADNWMDSFVARWKQAKRHALGVEEFCYLLQMLPLCHRKLQQEAHLSGNACRTMFSMYTRFACLLLFVASVHIRFALIIPCAAVMSSVVIGVRIDYHFGTDGDFPVYSEEAATFMSPSCHPAFVWNTCLGLLLALISIGKASIAVRMVQHLLALGRIGQTRSLPWWARSSTLLYLYSVTSITIGLPVMAICGSLAEIVAIFKVAWWNKRYFEFFVAPKVRNAVDA